MEMHEKNFKEKANTWDQEARDYDSNFNKNAISCYMRKTNLEIFRKYFRNHSRILDLGCGTGAEAMMLAKWGLKVTAVDISPKMIELAKNKANHRDLSKNLTFYVCPIEKINELNLSPYDGAYSSLGPLNCIKNLKDTVKIIANSINSRGFLIISVLNRICLGEILYFFFKRKPKKALRRITQRQFQAYIAHGADSILSYCYTPKEFYKNFSKFFNLIDILSIPVFSPPAYIIGNSQTFRILTRFLIKADKLLNRLPIFRNCGDQFIMILQKK